MPHRFAPWIYGIIQVTITTAAATGIATYQVMGFDGEFLLQWAVAWLVAWLTMLPVVILVAPFVQALVAAMTAHD